MISAESLPLKLGLLCLSVCIALGAVEISFVFFLESPRLFFGADTAAEVSYDSAIGWKPVLGGKAYSKDGILIEKSRLNSGTKRVLFLGDSVTSRGLVTDAFEPLFGSNVQLLNGGVPGFDTHQEVVLFEQHMLGTHPDLVIVLLHPNDFDFGIAAATDGEGNLRIANAYGDSLPANRTAFWNSRVYQFVMQSLLRVMALRFSPSETVFSNLVRLQELSKSNNFELLVVQLPWFKWPADWTTKEFARREQSLKILADSKICHLDTFEALRSAQGTMNSVQESAGDLHHPNKEFATILAGYIYNNAFKARKFISEEPRLELQCEHSV